LNKELYKIML